jgi:hypothetical protein
MSKNAKLTELQVIEIKQSVLSSNFLAKKYKVGKTTILRIKNGVTWTHLNDK